MRFILRNILFLFNLFFIAGLGLACLSPFISPAILWPVGFFGLTFKAWLLANIFLLGLWLLAGKRLWVYNLAILLAGSMIIARDIQFNSPDSSPEDFRVMHFNTEVLQVYKDGNTSEALNAYMVDQAFDFVVLVEWFNKKGSIDPKVYPHQQFVKLRSARNRYDYGLMVASRHPILHWERIEYGHASDNMTAFFDVEVGEEVIRIIATHLQSNSLGASDYHRFLDLDFDEEYNEFTRNTAIRLKWSMARRAKQTEKILQVIDESPYPVMILGDLNDTPQSYAYQQLRDGRKDAFVERGSGIGATFREPFPILRIDYILYDPVFDCTSYHESQAVESDHRLIEASFKLPWISYPTN